MQVLGTQRPVRAQTDWPGVIVKGSVPWRLFRGEGWIWQNIDVPDYVHFDTGFPSRPLRPRRSARR